MDWGYKAILTVTTVALLLTVARLLRRRVAGVLAGLPTVTGPALLWLALENGASYAVEAAIGGVVGGAVAIAAPAAAAFLRGHVAGLVGRIGFGGAFATLPLLLPVPLAALLAFGAGCRLTLASVRWLGWRAVPVIQRA